MSEITIKIKNFKEWHESHYKEQFEVFIDGEKIPRLESFSITVDNQIGEDVPNATKYLNYSIKQHIDYEDWEMP